MRDIIEGMQSIGFSQNEAKVFFALTLKNPMSGYEVAKNADITRTMVYDILKRLVQKGAVVEIDAETKLYSPVAYKELFKKYREEYIERLNELEEKMDSMETDSRTDSYLVKVLEHEEMLKEIRHLIETAKNEIYLSMWEEEALLFYESIKDAYDRGVNIITFSYGKLPWDFGMNYQYGISRKVLKDIWRRRRITVIVDRERILIGEGNEQIEDISIITSNTMITELAIDQMVLDIIQLNMFRTQKILPDVIESKQQYMEGITGFHKMIGIDPKKVPQRVEDD